MDRATRLHLALVAVGVAAALSFAIVLVFVTRFDPANLAFAIDLGLIFAYIGPPMFPVLAAAIAMVASEKYASLSGAILNGSMAWGVYFLALAVWVFTRPDGLDQAYSSIFFLPWMMSWFLLPFGFGIAFARYRARQR